MFAEVYEGTYRKSHVAIKVSKESNSTAFVLREADIMRYKLRFLKTALFSQ